MHAIHPSPSFRQCGGFTLIEVMVSAILLGTVITGATSLIGTGRTLEGSGNLRAQAVRIASNSMERTTHHYSAYPIASGAFLSNPSLTTESGTTCAANQIDSIYAREVTQWNDADGGASIDVPFQRICVKLIWTCGGLTDSVVLRKRVANVQ